MVLSCAALNCNKRSGSKDEDGREVTFHRFPLSNSALNQKWIAAIRRENFLPTRNLRLCSTHFEKICYLPNYVNRRQLRDDAVPTKFVFSNRQNKVCRKRSPLKSGNDFAGYRDSECVNEMSRPSTTAEHDYSMSSSFMFKHKYETSTEEKKNEIAKYKGCIKTQHYWKDKQEDLIAKRTLDNLRRELCRLCGQKGSELTPIFEPTIDMSKDMPISSKIDMYLPIKVKLDDSFPFCICSNCLLVLNHWHELYTTCVAADSVFSKTFGKESHASVNNPSTSEVQRNAETQTEQRFLGASKGTLNGTPTVAVTDELPSDSLRDETRGNDICTHCGESKTSKLEEDKLFKKEFAKSFHMYRNISYKCRFCYELFRDTADRKNHMAMCRQLSTICELCGHEVPCRKDLKRHKYDKHNASPQKYLCDKCHKFFKSTSILKIHVKRIHGADNSGKYCCELCGSLFMQEIYYNLHKRRHELGKVKTVFKMENFRQEVNSEGSENGIIYVCPVCQEKFNDMTSLAVHLAEKKELKCSLCPKVVYCEKSLFLHVCGQWTCQYCLKSFDKRVKWLVHERWHTGEKPIKCRKCDQTFRTWQSRRLHESYHEPSFQCTYCGKSFRNKYVFQDHVSCHEGKEFSCYVCDKKFSGRKSLGRHFRAFHKDLKSNLY